MTRVKLTSSAPNAVIFLLLDQLNIAAQSVVAFLILSKSLSITPLQSGVISLVFGASGEVSVLQGI